MLSAAVSQQRKPLLVAFTALLLLRSRLLEIPQEALARALERRGLSSKLSKEELAQALQQLYVKEPDGSKTLLVPSPNGISKASHNNVVLIKRFISLAPGSNQTNTHLSTRPRCQTLPTNPINAQAKS